MRRSIKLIIFSAAFLLIGLASCNPRKAIEFKEAIVQKERVAFNILIAKNGSEEQKLKYLVEDDYKGALASVDRQEKEFDTLIREIEALPVEGIKQGSELKTAAMNYYVALKELQVFDRLEIAHQEASLHFEGEELRVAQHRSLELSRQKQRMYKKLYEKERAFYRALEKFSSVNSI